LTGPIFGLAWAADLAGAIRHGCRDRTCDAGLCCDGARSGDHRRTTLVDVVELLAVVGGFTLVLDLRRHGRRSRTAECCDFGGLWTDGDAPAASVIGDSCRVVDDDRAAVDVGDVDVDAIDCAVVVEVVSVPVAAVIAVTGVTEAVVDASIEADVEAPVATVEAPAAVVPTPVAGSPERSIVRRSAPCAGNPVVADGTPIPVAGCPDVVGSGGYWLVVFGERRWGLVGVFDGSRLAFLIKLIEGLGVLVGLVLIGRWRRCLNGSGLFWILLCGLLRSALITRGKNLSLCRRGCDGRGRWKLGGVCGGHVGISRIGAGAIGCDGSVGVHSVAACHTEGCCDTKRNT
jgi:hypothetical protein